MRDGPNRVFLDPYGVLNPSLSPGEAAYNNTVRLLTTEYGFNTYDALNVSVEKRYSNNFSLRGAYSYSLSRGVAAGQGDTPQLQVGTDLKLDEYDAPSGTSRAHNGNISGRLEIPKTRGLTLSGTIRMMTGERFTIQDDTLDLDMNRINFQPLPAGTYNPDPRAGEYVMRDVENTGGRNGAVGPRSCSSTCALATGRDWADGARWTSFTRPST